MEFAKWTTAIDVMAGLPPNSFPVDVSSTGFSIFDPNFVHGKIPLPGKNNKLFSDTVQGIWEAFAVVDGYIDKSCLRGVPKKRSSPECMWFFMNKAITWEEARRNIYIPTYVYMYNMLQKDIKIGFYNIAKSNITLYFYDNSNNPDPLKRSNDFSHAYLVQWCINNDLKKLHDADQKYSIVENIGGMMDTTSIMDMYNGGMQ